jgi:hypothetical protein
MLFPDSLLATSNHQALSTGLNLYPYIRLSPRRGSESVDLAGLFARPYILANFAAFLKSQLLINAFTHFRCL